MTRLSTYRSKRRASITSEPGVAPEQHARADLSWGPDGRRWVVQHHDASRLHYDLRLEHDGVLLSWAVPKGPPMHPGRKALAVHVEDHPLDYADFEGTIPEGQYGGGTVLVWDRGGYEPIGADDLAEMYQRGRLKFRLRGEKLRGRFTLVKMAGPRSDGGRNWLLVKDRDEHIRADDEPDITEAEPLSVKTGRSLEQIASGEVAETAGVTAIEQDPPKQAVRAKMPESIPPQLATLVDTAPVGEQWIHEIKFDGYRALIYLAAGQMRLLTRNGKDWTDRFRAIGQALAHLPARNAIFDGELVAFEPSGRTSFQQLQNALRHRSHVTFVAFDLLYLDGYDLRACPQIERKQRLRELIDEGVGLDDPTIRYVDHQPGSGRVFFKHACHAELEGIISKRADAPYTSGRSRTWTKTKCSKRQEFVVVGWTKPSGSRRGFGSLLLAYHDADHLLQYCGRVGTGFNAQSLKSIRERLDGLARKSPAVADAPTRERREARWVTPQLVAEVAFAGWTDDGMLRHAAFQGLRDDKPADAVVREVEKPEPEVTAMAGQNDKAAGNNRSVTSPGRGPQPVEVAGVSLSNADRVLYPEQGATKADLAAHYERVADRLLAYIADRPLSVVRCPRGRGAHCFYQKHISEGLPAEIQSIDVAEAGEKSEQYLAVSNLAGVIALVQIGVLEIHPWSSRRDRLDRPDRLIFDLDPGPEVTWEQVIDAAMLVRDSLEQIGLQSFVQATGGKGLHVIAPIRRTLDWSSVKQLTHAIATAIASAHPKRYVAVMTKAKRKGRVFIDYLRNSRGATAAAPYSTRARHGAPVVTPLRWDELATLDAPDHYTLANLPRRLAQLKHDPWAELDDLQQTVSRKVLNMLDIAAD
ncbi:DNA ligase D [Phycisphaerales bacterium AB-hyl4]|uniref:DNA ligase (ATP) n=1 Tax=Natronomicrosphaera hydrolytica TaxID=3242702 RepID=A0ABV4U4S1_9BACT